MSAAQNIRVQKSIVINFVKVSQVLDCLLTEEQINSKVNDGLSWAEDSWDAEAHFNEVD